VIVVIQCAGSKQANAGTLRTTDGKPVLFVAHPEKAPEADNRVYARPDDPASGGCSWREALLAYNERPGTNPLGLLPAYELYKNEIYRSLVRRYGIENTFILSAGWGLLNAAFLTPSYDITFSASAEDFVRRRKGDSYRDFCMLPDDVDGPVVFFGSKEYVPLFACLTRTMNAEKLVFYNSQQPPVADGCVLKRFETRTRTNWQYECAAAFACQDRLIE
jgi:hypothetical protein